jgi:hypothetical protein
MSRFAPTRRHVLREADHKQTGHMMQGGQNGARRARRMRLGLLPGAKDQVGSWVRGHAGMRHRGEDDWLPLSVHSRLVTLQSDWPSTRLGRICWVLCSAVGIARHMRSAGLEHTVKNSRLHGMAEYNALSCYFRAMSGMRRSHDISRPSLSPAFPRLGRCTAPRCFRPSACPSRHAPFAHLHTVVLSY